MKKLTLLIYFFLPGTLHAYGRFYNPETPQKVQGDFNDVFDELTKTEKSVNSSSSTYAVKSHLPINVKDSPYNAVCDGVTDDSAAFTKAINAAELVALNLGGYNSSIYVPPGVCKVGVFIGTQNVSLEGVPGSTFLVPKDSSTFILNYTGNGSADRRYVRGIYFYGNGANIPAVGAGNGRFVYINSSSFIEFQNCQFQSGEYGVYSNGSEWNHFFNCHFIGMKRGTILTTKNNDILGNNPINNQNSAASWFEQCDWWGNNISFYIDDPDNGVGDHQAAISFKQCEFLTSTSAIVAVFPKGVATLYYALSIDYCWFEGNGGTHVISTGNFSFNGNSWRQGDLAVSGAQVTVQHTFHGGGFISLTNGAHFVADDIHMAGSIEASTDTTGYGNNVLMDYQSGRVLDWFYTDNLSSFNPDRPAATRTHPHLSIIPDSLGKNLISPQTQSCSTGTLPSAISGSPVVSFSSAGLYNDKSVKIVGKAGDSVRWSAIVSSANWYVTNFSVRSETGITPLTSTFTVSNNTNIIFPTQFPMRISPTWTTFGAVGQPLGSGTIGLDMTLQTATTLYFSMIQVVAFPTLQEAKDFYNSSAFYLSTTEVTVSSSSGVSTSPGGSNTNVQSKQAGSFYGDNGFQYDSSVSSVTIGGKIGATVNGTSFLFDDHNVAGDPSITLEDTNGSPNGALIFTEFGVENAKLLDSTGEFDINASTANTTAAITRVAFRKSNQHIEFRKADGSIALDFNPVGNSSFTIPVVLTTLLSVTSLATDSTGKIIAGSGGATIYNATSTAGFPFGFSASTGIYTSTVTILGALSVGTDTARTNLKAQMHIVTPGTRIGLVLQDPASGGGGAGSVDLMESWDDNGVIMSSITRDGSYVTQSSITASVGQIGPKTITASYQMGISSSSTGIFSMDISNKGIVSYPSNPGLSLTSCGTSPSVIGSNMGGAITVGSGVSVTACTLNFSPAFINTPLDCVESDDNTAITGSVTSLSNTAVTFSLAASLAGGHIYYHCDGND